MNEKHTGRIIRVYLVLAIVLCMQMWAGASETAAADTSATQQISISKAQITLSGEEYTYDGETHIPSVTVQLDGQTLTKDTDYTLTYSGDCTQIGVYTVTVTGTGDYTGRASGTFTIKPGSVTVKSAVCTSAGSITVKWEKLSGSVRYQIAYRQKGTSSWITKNVSADTVKKTISGLTEDKTYYIKVRAYQVAGSVNIYGSWSAGETVKCELSGKWKNNGSYYYYKYIDGSKATGLTKIGSQIYYFDSKGRQKTGWQKIDGDYYYFQIKNGKKGYMVKSDKVNSITLRKNGKAKTLGNSSRLKVLVQAQKFVEKYTVPVMSKSEKLKTCFNAMIKNYTYRGSPTFKKTSDWEVSYALSMFENKHGSCYEYGAAFAFVGNAIGYTSYAISSGGHGWAEVDGYVFDLAWAQVDKSSNYYKRSYDTKATGMAPNYKKARNYVKKI